MDLHVWRLSDNENKMQIASIDEEFLKATNKLQSHLSHLLFWEHDSVSERERHTFALLGSDIIQRNHAILQYMTKKATVLAQWKTLVDFSLLSTAFTQNYYLQEFKQIMYQHNTHLWQFEPLLFPWLKTSIRELYDSYKGRGIVICTGNGHFQFAFLLVKSLRNVLKCSLPIEIAYADDEDLSVANRDIITQFKDVTCINLSKLMIRSGLEGVNGWWWKVFSIIMSSFSEVIFMDGTFLFHFLNGSRRTFHGRSRDSLSTFKLFEIWYSNLQGSANQVRQGL
jgi:hypothetical protein